MSLCAGMLQYGFKPSGIILENHPDGMINASEIIVDNALSGIDYNADFIDKISRSSRRR